MYEKLNNVFNVIIRGISETAIAYLPSIILIYFFAEIDSYTLINKIVFFSVMNYLSSYMLSYYVLRGDKLNRKNKSILVLSAIVLSFVSSYITSKDILIFVFITYLFVWYVSISSIVEEKDFQSVKKIFVVSVVFYLLILFVLNLLDRDSDTAQKLNELFVIYVGASLSYFAALNIEKAYNKRASNTLNKVNNIKIINLISNFLILLFLIFSTTGLFGFWKRLFSTNVFRVLSVIFNKAIEILLYPIFFLISKLGELIFKNGDFSILERLNSGETPSEIEKIAEESLSPKSQIILEKVFLFIKWIIIVLVLYIIIRYIIKAINNMRSPKMDDEGEEEKEFITSPKDIAERMKETMKELMHSLTNLFSKPDDNVSRLHIIRRIYIDTILILKEEGHEFKKFYTPNEYLLTLEETKFKDSGIEELTRIYNDFRYGLKEPVDEEVSKCIEIKNNIYKIANDK